MHKMITLVDGVEQNRLYPATFEIPSEEAKAAVRPGDFVKIGFQYQGLCERMWVQVHGDGFGELNNDPVRVPMVCGETVHYERYHILSIIKASHEEQQAVEEAVKVIDRARMVNVLA